MLALSSVSFQGIEQMLEVSREICWKQRRLLQCSIRELHSLPVVSRRAAGGGFAHSVFTYSRSVTKLCLRQHLSVRQLPILQDGYSFPAALACASTSPVGTIHSEIAAFLDELPFHTYRYHGVPCASEYIIRDM
jgi:hypothetical protein